RIMPPRWMDRRGGRDEKTLPPDRNILAERIPCRRKDNCGQTGTSPKCLETAVPLRVDLTQFEECAERLFPPVAGPPIPDRPSQCRHLHQSGMMLAAPCLDAGQTAG